MGMAYDEMFYGGMVLSSGRMASPLNLRTGFIIEASFVGPGDQQYHNGKGLRVYNLSSGKTLNKIQKSPEANLFCLPFFCQLFS